MRPLPADHRELLNRFADVRVAVVGDLMLDEYLWGDATRISPEAPVMVVRLRRESYVPGGAGNVVNNLVALGAAVSVVGLIGDDAGGRSLVEALRAEGADTTGVVVDATRPTTTKTRVVAHSQQVLRIDREESGCVSTIVRDQLADRIRDAVSSCDAVLVSDYRKGVVTDWMGSRIVGCAADLGVLLTANLKPPNARALPGADMLSFNLVEAQQVLGRDGFESNERLVADGSELRHIVGSKAVLVTRGSKGLCAWSDASDMVTVDAHPVEVYDVAGAGDTAISTLTLALAAGIGLPDAADLANRAAALVVQKVGVATVTIDELRGSGV